MSKTHIIILSAAGFVKCPMIVCCSHVNAGDKILAAVYGYAACDYGTPC
jgi:hypothetical protein